QVAAADARGGTRVVRDLRPRIAGVVAAVDADRRRRSVRRDRRVQPRRIARRDREVHLVDVRGESVGERLPRDATVGGLEQSAAVACPDGVLPWTLALLPEVRVHDAGIRRVDVDVVAAGVLVALEGVGEAAAGVGGQIDAALLAGPVRMSEHGDEESVGIRGVDRDHRDLLRVPEAEVRPRLAGVCGLVDPVADGQVGAREPFAAAYIYGIGVRRGDRDRADGLRGLLVEDRLPGATRVVGLPDAAVHLRHVERVGLRRDAGT